LQWCNDVGRYMYFSGVKYVFFFLLVFAASAANGQEPVYYNYRSNNGLPSNEVYNVQADRNGFLWFATDRGVARFDGSHFVTFSVNDGIEGNVVNDIFIAPNGDVWIVADAQRLYRFTGNGFEAYRYNHLVEKACKNVSKAWISQVRFENDYPAWFSIRVGGWLYISAGGNVLQDNRQFPENMLLCNDEKQLALYYQAPLAEPLKNKPKPEFYFKGKIYHTASSSAGIYRKRSNGNVLVAFGENLFELHNNEVVNHYKFPNFITTLYEDNKQRLWVTIYGSGARAYPPNSFPTVQNEKIYFASTRISSITQDREGGYWFCSYERGVFYVPDLDVVSIETEQMGTDEFFQELLSVDNNRLYAASSKSRIFELTGQQPLKFVFSGPNQKITTNCNDLVYDAKTQVLYGCFSQGVYTYNTVTKSTASYSVSSRSVLPVKNDFYVLGPVNLKRNTMEDAVSYMKGTFFSIISLTDNQWLIGYENGLLKYADTGFTPFLPGIVNKRVTSIKQLANGWVVAATLGQGLVLIKGGRVLPVLLGQGNSINMVNDIAVNGNTVWAATEAGIASARLDNPEKPLMSAIAADNRFPYNNTRKIACMGERIYVLAQNKLIVFPENYPVNKEQPPVWLRQLIVGDSIRIKPGDKHHFNFYDNRFRFAFDGVCFRCGTSIRYQYRLVGLHSEWYFTGQPYVEYPSLPPGSYTFEVMAINESNITSATPAAYSFTIPSPFWKKGWFRVIAVLVAALFAAWLINRRLKKIQLRNRERELLLATEQVALSAQINPHFIFNSLNSIQHLIIKEDRQQATLYMAQFSRLMRLSLENSRKKWVPVKDEIELLKLYLELESLRFKDKFTYSILADDDITNSSLRIPAMLIQPFVENAIRHGVNNLVGKTGKATVLLVFKGAQLLTTVEDNGIGRQKALTLQGTGKNHLSSGMQITEERLQLLCRETGTPWFFEIIDKQDSTGAAAGTLVKFNMPFLQTDSGITN
jgi:Histidine kinase/Y_Y_Y domain/Two component regulator propeller